MVEQFINFKSIAFQASQNYNKIQLHNTFLFSRLSVKCCHFKKTPLTDNIPWKGQMPDSVTWVTCSLLSFQSYL